MRSRLTYANVMATVAVFVALGGVSWAAVRVTGRQVVNGSLTGKDVRNGTLGRPDLGFRVKDGGIGPQGPTGPRGLPGTAAAKGDPGPQGPPGQTGATGTFSTANVTIRTLEASGTGSALDQANCQPGETAISGGVVGAQAGDPASASTTRPVDQNGDDRPDAWLGGSIADDAGATVAATVYVVCAQ
jgi:hypothetical protein